VRVLVVVVLLLLTRRKVPPSRSLDTRGRNGNQKKSFKVFAMVNDATEDTYFWLKLFAASFAIVSGLGYRWFGVHVAACRLWMRRIDKLAVSDGEYVKRPAVEALFTAALKSEDHETVLLYGQRGSGKTSFIRSALNGRRGVISIRISKKTNDEVTKEFIEEVSNKVDFFGSAQNRTFVEDVFSACPVRPVVVVSLEAKTTGEVLEAVLIMCKILSYDMPKKGSPRMIVDISSSRAAIDATMKLEDLRVIGVHVGHFSPPEALLYASERMPASLIDTRRREKIARSVAAKFDGRVLTLKKVCLAIRKGDPTDVDIIDGRIEAEREKVEKKALAGWDIFKEKLAVKLDNDYDVNAVEEVVRLLLQGPQDSSTIIDLLSRKSGDVQRLTRRDIGLFNADAGSPPFNIDPFETVLSLSGKAIESVLRKKYN
jgi:energy-coupling factor transporter ATP-binding protein EcfA2